MIILAYRFTEKNIFVGNMRANQGANKRKEKKAQNLFLSTSE